MGDKVRLFFTTREGESGLSGSQQKGLEKFSECLHSLKIWVAFLRMA